MNKKLLITTILGVGLFASSNAYASDATERHLEYLAFTNSQNNPDIVYPYNNAFYVAGTKHNSVEAALAAYERVNPNQTFEIEDNGDIVYITQFNLEIRNPNGTSIKFEKNESFINGTRYTDDDSFLNALHNTPGLAITGDSKFTMNGETLSFAELEKQLEDPEVVEVFKEVLGISVEDLREIRKEITAFNAAQSQLENVRSQLNNTKHIQEARDSLSKLEAQANRTPAVEAQIQKLQTDIANSANKPTLTPASPEVQELFKAQVLLLSQDNQSGNPLLQAASTGQLKKVQELQDTILPDASKAKALSELSPVQIPDTITTDTLVASADTVTGVVDNRLSGFAPIGIASGDFLQNLGGWVKGLYTKAEQKAYGLTPGYSLNQSGAAIGFDAGDEIKVGAAYSFAKSDVTAKGIKAKENITNHIGTIYGLAFLNNHFFASGQGSYGVGNIKKSRNTGDLNNNIATAKPKGNIMSGKVEVGYDYNFENSPLHILPSVGLAHNSVSVKGYKETGSGLNRKVSKRNVSKTSALLGVMAKYEANMGSAIVIPEVHANVDYAINSKNDKTKVTIFDGLAPIVTPSTKLSKLKYIIGTSVKFMQSKVFNAGIGYDLGLGKKIISHTGSVNVRVEF